MDLTYETEAFARSLRAKGRSDTTIKTYTKAIRSLRDWLDNRGGSLAQADVTRRDLEDFLGAELARGLSKQTVHQHFQSLRQFFAFYARENDTQSPMTAMEAPRVPFNPPPVLDPDDLGALFAACAGKTFEDRRDLAILSLFADTGMRRSELAGLRLDDVDLHDQLATVTGKGDRRRVIPYGSQTAMRLDRYLRLRRQHRETALPWLWLGKKGRLTVFGIEDVVSDRGGKAGVRLHPHLFRHTFAHMWLDNGGNEGDLMRLAGWRSSQMLQRYGASAASARARRAYLGRSPVDLLGRKA